MGGLPPLDAHLELTPGPEIRHLVADRLGSPGASTGFPTMDIAASEALVAFYWRPGCDFW
jgi:hypothetical protein